MGQSAPTSAKGPSAKASAKTNESPKLAPSLEKSGDADKVRLINKMLAQKWQENKLTPSARASDHEFIRRASLDIIGRIATPEEINAFLKDPVSTRRALLIDRLLSQKDKQEGHIEYAKNWANIWTVWLLTRSGQSLYHEQMHKWLEEQQFGKEGMSYKNMVTELLTAWGRTNENGAVNYVLAHLGEPVPNGNAAQEGKFNMVPLTSRTARLFVGVQIQCAQCHPHPFNKEWKQSDFWNTNAFFRQVDAPKGRPGGNRMAMEMVLELKDDLNLNADGAVFYEDRRGMIHEAKPFFSLDKQLDREARRVAPNVNRRLELAKFVTSSKNFAKVYVNRMWAHFLGRGFTNPVDDFGPENEPSHPELLEELAAEFVHYGYDPKRLIRWICNSDAYSLSSVANKTNDAADAEPYFSRMLLKAMTPEQLFDSLMTATQAEMFESKENRKKLRDQWMRNLTANFGDDEGNEVTFNGTVVQALMMMNGGELNNAVSKLAPILTKRHTSSGIVDQLYLATLNRSPTPGERAKILGIYRSAPVKKKDGLSFCQDLFWALLNSNEFILNH